MRKLVTLMTVGMLVALTLPASAAKPTSNHLVTWTVDGGTITLDTSSHEVSVEIQEDIWTECAGAGAFGTIHITGTTIADEVVTARQGRVGSFSAETIELTTLVVVGGCGDYAGDQMTTSVSGTYETEKGKALDRWRDQRGRNIVRSGFGTLSVGSLVEVQASIQLHSTISN